MGEIIYKKQQYSGSSETASAIDYDNSTSGLVANNVQDAVDEVTENLTANGGTYTNFPFKVGVTSDGKLGYHDIVGGADTVLPFR